MHYINFNKILSYNIPVNVIIAGRGLGKSFSVKNYVINDYLKNKNEFIYIRRYDNELKQIFEKTSMKISENKKDFFDDIKFKFPENELQAKNRKFYIDNECFGYSKRLTEAQDLKSNSYEKVTNIIFDEYPIELNAKRYYLKNEAMLLLGMIDSIIRNKSKKQVRIFILGNSTEDLEYSPLFTFFNLQLPYNSEFKTFKNNTILLYYANDEKLIKARENTLIGELAKDTRYFDYAMKNKILTKNKNFIMKKSNTAKFSFSFIYNTDIFGVWIDYKFRKNIYFKGL